MAQPKSNMAEHKSKMADDKFKMADTKSKMADDRSKMADEQVSSDEDSEPETLKAPDGGYGWVIVFAAFVCNMIADGTAFSFGVLYDDLLEHFADSKSKTSWIGSIFMGVPLLASPIASALINKYGCRAVSIAGGLLTTAGFVLSYFADSIEFLCFSFGLVSGVGLAMVYTPAVVIVAFYFEKKRALATGLSVAGSGIGTVAFAPFVEYLTNVYGWRGAILVLAGVMLNTCVFGALYRPLALFQPKKKKKTSENQRTENTNTVAVFDSATCSSHIAKIRELYSDPYSHSLIQFPTYLTENDHSNGSHGDKKCHKRRETVPVVITSSTSVEKLNRTGSEGQLNEHSEERDIPSNQLSNTARSHGNNENHLGNVVPSTSNGTPSIPPSPELFRSNVETSRRSDGQSTVGNGKLRSHTNTSEQSKTSANDRLHPLYRRDIFYKGSLLWLPQTRSPARVSSCPDLHRRADSPDDDDDDERRCCQWKHVKRVVKEMLDVSIFYRPLYLLFFISNFLLYMWYDIPYFYLPNSATDLGLHEDQASWIISVIGIGNTIGQVAFGVIADRPKCNNSFVYGGGIVLCGLSIMFIPVCADMGSLSTVGCLFGTFIGANYALCSIIIVDLLSLEKLTNAYGIMLCGQGVANLIGPPLGGWLSDLTGTYELTYVCAGAFIMLSGAVMVAVALYQFRQPKPMQRVDPEMTKPLNA